MIIFFCHFSLPGLWLFPACFCQYPLSHKNPAWNILLSRSKRENLKVTFGKVPFTWYFVDTHQQTRKWTSSKKLNLRWYSAPGTPSGCPEVPKQPSTRAIRRAFASEFTGQNVPLVGAFSCKRSICYSRKQRKYSEMNVSIRNIPATIISVIIRQD